jgi:hypothetical protein
MTAPQEQGLDPVSKTWLDMYNNGPAYSPAEVVLHKLKRLDVSTQEAVDPLHRRVAEELSLVPGLRDSLGLHQEYSYILGKMVLRLTGWVLRDDRQHEVVTKTMAIKVPASWWQMLKQDCLPAWLVRRLPVRTRDVTETFAFEQEVRVCPHADVTFRDPAHLEFMTFRAGALPGDGALYAIEGESNSYQRHMLQNFCGAIDRRRPDYIEARVPFGQEASFLDWMSYQKGLVFRRIDERDNDAGHGEGHAAGVAQGDSDPPRQP